MTLMQKAVTPALTRAILTAGHDRVAGYVVRAHAAMVAAAPRLWRDRRRTFARARVAPAEFTNLLRRHWISPRQVAAL